MDLLTSDRSAYRLSHPLVSRRNPGIGQWPCLGWTLDEWAINLEDVMMEFRVHQFVDDRKNIPQWEVRNLMQFSSNFSKFLKWTRSKSFNQSERLPAKIIKPNENDYFDFLNPDEHWVYSSYNRLSNLIKPNHPFLSSIDWSKLGVLGTTVEDLSPEKSTLWIGTNGAQTPCHYDTYGYNLVVQLHGRKRWILFPPESTPCLYPTRTPYEESSVWSQVNILNPDLAAHPNFVKANIFSVILEAGDVLYVPKHWWHFVRSEADNLDEISISINLWCPQNDERDQLKESLVRFLFTGLIPIYDDEQESSKDIEQKSQDARLPLMNTKEIDLTAPGEILQLVLQLVDQVTSKKCSQVSVQNELEEDLLKKGFQPVNEVDWQQLSQELNWTSTCVKESEEMAHKADVRTILNAIFQPDVIELIASKLVKSECK